MNVRDIYFQNHLHIQEATYSCGPCSILNVLQLKENFSHTEDELIKLCDAKEKIGTSNKNLVKAASQVGLDIVEEKKNGSIEDIERNLDAGAYVIVCYWYAYDDDGHYAVITEYDEQAFLFRDSSYGLFRLKKKYFKKFWFNSDKTIHGWYLAVK